MMNYDTHIFIEKIESVIGVFFLYQKSEEDIIVRFYSGKTGRIVLVDISDDFILDDVGIGCLIELGCADYIPSWYPDYPFQPPGNIRDS